MKPLFNNVIIKVSEPETTKSGLYIPDTAKEKPSEGKVIAVGPEVKGCKVKDSVVFKKWGGTEYKDYLIIEDKDILLVLN